MSQHELISCIVPVFNGEQYLVETLGSIRSQTHSPLEIIVVDDGSTDASAKLAEQVGDVRVIRQPNLGQPAAANAGIAASSADFVAFLDADDRWRPHKLERQLSLLRSDRDLGYCITHIRNFLSPELVEGGAVPDADFEREYVGHVAPTLLARRGLFDEVGGFEASLRHAHDTDWFVRARGAGARFGVVPEVLVDRRIHHGNRSRTQGARSRAEYLRFVKQLLDKRRAEPRL